MPKARLVLKGDGTYIDKEKRTFKMTQDISGKIGNIPNVIDNTSSTSRTDALSANMGRHLQDQIDNLSSTTHFLSGWDCATGLPLTNPTVNPYTYTAGDYYIINNVASGGGTNYKPQGGTYTQGVPSTEIEQGSPQINDWYVFDGSVWILQKTSIPAVVVDSSLDSTSRNPVENRAIAQELDGKQDTIADLQDIRDGAALGETSIQPGDNITSLNNNANYINAGYVAWGNISGTLSSQSDLQSALNDKQDKLTAGAGILIDANNVISTTGGGGGGGGVWGAITGTLSDQIDLQTALDGKQKVLTPGQNISISSDGTISATNTTYTAGANIQISGTIISATNTTYTAGSGISIDANNVISATGGGGGGSYSAGAGINIDANNVISNTMPFNPTNVGTAGDVLYKSTNGMSWGPSLPQIITDETNIWELAPGEYIIGLNAQTSDASPIKLNCKSTGAEEVGYFYAWYGSILTVAENYSQGVNLGLYYTMISGWRIHYGYANSTNGTYRKIFLHQNDPITLTCASYLDVDLNESLNYTLLLDQDCSLTFGQQTGHATFTPGCVYQFLIIQDSTGGHTLTLPNNFIYAGGNRTFPTTAGSICKLIVDYQDGNYFASITQYN